jgi:hypothetical protein
VLTAESDLVARVRIVDPGAEVAIDEPRVREMVVVADVLEPLKGGYAEKQLRFLQHGHGVPQYEKGEEVALFAQRIERSRELGGSPIAGRVHWVSVQEAGGKFRLDDATRAGFAGTVRAYAALEALPPEEQLDALHRITLDLLASLDERLASSAVRDLVLAAAAPLVTAADLPQLEPVLANPKTAVGVRIALLAELERRGLVEAPPRWAELLRTTSGPDRLAVVRAAGAHPSAPVAKALVALLGSDNPHLVSAAAISLGSDSPRVRMAAIRGLGRVGTPGARAVLAEAAASHPDEATRRRAAAEAKL